MERVLGRVNAFVVCSKIVYGLFPLITARTAVINRLTNTLHQHI